MVGSENSTVKVILGLVSYWVLPEWASDVCRWRCNYMPRADCVVTVKRCDVNDDALNRSGHQRQTSVLDQCNLCMIDADAYGAQG